MVTGDVACVSRLYKQSVSKIKVSRKIANLGRTREDREKTRARRNKAWAVRMSIRKPSFLTYTTYSELTSYDKQQKLEQWSNSLMDNVLSSVDKTIQDALFINDVSHPVSGRLTVFAQRLPEDGVLDDLTQAYTNDVEMFSTVQQLTKFPSPAPGTNKNPPVPLMSSDVALARCVCGDVCTSLYAREGEGSCGRTYFVVGDCCAWRDIVHSDTKRSGKIDKRVWKKMYKIVKNMVTAM